MLTKFDGILLDNQAESALFNAIFSNNKEQISALLNKEPELALERKSFTDDVGRNFTNVSAFEYTLCTGKIDICHLMINRLPFTELGEKIRKELVRQYEQLEKEGIYYRLEEKDQHEKPFDINLFQKLQRQKALSLQDWRSVCKEYQMSITLVSAQSKQSLNLEYIEINQAILDDSTSSSLTFSEQNMENLARLKNKFFLLDKPVYALRKFCESAESIASREQRTLRQFPKPINDLIFGSESKLLIKHFFQTQSD